jgi:hypothetical protein
VSSTPVPRDIDREGDRHGSDDANKSAKKREIVPDGMNVELPLLDFMKTNTQHWADKGRQFPSFHLVEARRLSKPERCRAQERSKMATTKRMNSTHQQNSIPSSRPG